MILTPELAREYAVKTERTLLRDLDELQQMQIVIVEGGKYRLNMGPLFDHMARRRLKAATAA